MNHSSAGDAAGLPSLISILVLGVASLLLNSLPPQAAHGAQFLGEFSYYSPGSTDPSLVVYVPDGGADPEVPTLLYIHGGGWGSGNQEDNLAVLMPIVDAGYSLVSCNYTLSTHVSPSYPQAVHAKFVERRHRRAQRVEPLRQPAPLNARHSRRHSSNE